MYTRKTILVLALAAVLAVSLSGCSSKKVVTAPAAESATPINTVSASGHGEVAAAPDEAIMSFGVTRRDKDAKKALDAASKAAEKVGAELQKQGVKKDDVQTSGVTVYPQYRESGGKAVIDGFEASINVTAKVTDLGSLGKVITALSNAGADTINGPTFSIGDDSDFRAKAIEAAVADAKKSAQAMASAAGKEVGEVVSITSSGISVPVTPLYGAAERMSLDAAKAVPIETGQLDVTADVTVVFELR